MGPMTWLKMLIASIRPRNHPGIQELAGGSSEQIRARLPLWYQNSREWSGGTAAGRAVPIN